MMLIPYIGSGFPPQFKPCLSGRNALQCSWMDIVWAAITYGKAKPSCLLKYNWHSVSDIIVKTYSIYANLRQQGTHLTRSSLYDELDPTEKSAASYFLGMTMAKLFASELMDLPWLFHVSQAHNHGAILTFSNKSKSQPDLIGQNAFGDWFVLEAKGRSNGFDKNALDRAKSQTKMIHTINGVIPSCRVAIQSYFDNDVLSVRLDDPDDMDNEAARIHIDTNEAIINYYAIADTMTAAQRTKEIINNQEYATKYDEHSGVTIGLDTSIMESIASGRIEDITDSRDRLRSQRMTEIDNLISVYPDGILIKLDARWSEQEMSLDPIARNG